MAVASKSTASVRQPQAPSKAKLPTTAGVNSLSPQVKLYNRSTLKGQTVPILPSAKPAPLWLLRLCSLQNCSMFVTFPLMVGLLSIYGWTVYSQQKWTQAYRQLETLQRHERQLTTTNEVLKNQLAQEAEQPAQGLVPSESASAIFLSPTSKRFTPANQSTVAASSTTRNKLTTIPLGY